MEKLAENPRAAFERNWDVHRLKQETNLLLWLTQEVFSDKTEQALFRSLKSKSNWVRLEETEKWVWYIIRHGDDFIDELWAWLAYTWDIKELEAYFQDMDELEEQQREEELNPIETALYSLKWVNSEVIIVWIKNQLQDLYSQVIH